MANHSSSERNAISPQQISQIQALANSIRYGSITLVIQDGRLIQIDRSEKIRLPAEQKY